MMNSKKDRIIGGMILFLSICTTFFLELTLIQSTKSLEEGRKIIKTLENPQALPSNEKHLIHFCALPTTGFDFAEDGVGRIPFVFDETFGIVARGLRLYRTVEMLQWVETIHQSTESFIPTDDDQPIRRTSEKTYTYDMEWKSSPVESSKFYHSGYDNPSESAWLYKTKTFETERAYVGDFKLPSDLIDQIRRREEVVLGLQNQRAMNNILSQRVNKKFEDAPALKNMVIEENYFLLRKRRKEYSIGDLRVSFKSIPVYMVSIVAMQKKENLVPFPTKFGDKLFILVDGIQTAEEIFDAKLKEYTRDQRFYRFFCAVVSFMGFLTLHQELITTYLKPYSSVHKVLLAMILSWTVTWILASLPWMTYRLIEALCMCFVGGLPVFLLRLRIHSQVQQSDWNKHQ